MSNSEKREHLGFAYRYGIAILPNTEVKKARSWINYLRREAYDKDFAIMYYNGKLQIIYLKQFTKEGKIK